MKRYAKFFPKRRKFCQGFWSDVRDLPCCQGAEPTDDKLALMDVDSRKESTIAVFLTRFKVAFCSDEATLTHIAEHGRASRNSKTMVLQNPKFGRPGLSH